MQSRIDNYNSTYNYFKSNKPGHIVLMKIAPVFFPRIHDYKNWHDLTLSRQQWIRDSRQFIKGADVLFATDAIDKRWTEQQPEYLLYEDAKPSNWLQHYDVLLRDVGDYKIPIWGGINYDAGTQNGSPNLTDRQLHNIIKWHTYAGIIKGATGLLFFGQHHAFDNIQVGRVWTELKSIINEMTHTLGLDKNLFVLPNSFSAGHI